MAQWRVVVFLLLAGLVAQVPPVMAQSEWSDRGPVFGSDQQQKAEQEEAERAARRKTYEPVVYPKYMEGGERPDIKPAAPPIVYFDRAEEVGSIIIDTEARKLYFILPNRQAYEYPISVGREGFTWTGTERISRIASWPSWTPPPEMRDRIAGLPVTVSGGIKNPQGARALYLGNTVYRIHGTNNDRSVGRANSSGCFRLTNEHVIHLASIAKVGAKVRVMQTYAGGVSPNAPLSSLFDFGLFGSDPAKPAAKPAKTKKPAAKKPAATSPASASASQAPAAQAPAAQAPAAPAAAAKAEDTGGSASAAKTAAQQ
ncbi:MAG: L,D-transpeptidase [Hyphomicrobium sp.]|jgi:lipoprotein-anchoring transpeptidase ErfK/SrfK|nr:L,D-transpeptidase [Hyphomicrobium sp.]